MRGGEKRGGEGKVGEQGRVGAWRGGVMMLREG